MIQSCGRSLKVLTISNNPLRNLGASYILHACLNHHRRAARAVNSLKAQMIATSPAPSQSPRQNQAQLEQRKYNDTRSLTVPILRAGGGHIYQDLDLLEKYYYDIKKNHEDYHGSNSDANISNININRTYIKKDSKCRSNNGGNNCIFIHQMMMMMMMMMMVFIMMIMITRYQIVSKTAINTITMALRITIVSLVIVVMKSKITIIVSIMFYLCFYKTSITSE